VKFDTIAEAFQKIEKESSRLAITRILADLLKNATHSEAAIICNHKRKPPKNWEESLAKKIERLKVLKNSPKKTKRLEERVQALEFEVEGVFSPLPCTIRLLGLSSFRNFP